MKNWQLAVIVVTILLAALLNGGIYQIVPAGGKSDDSGYGTGYKINRFTGKTWILDGDTNNPMEYRIKQSQ